MEHNIERTIREKVNSVEQTPVAWEKELAWSKIERSSANKFRSPVFYYAAASVTLAIGLTFLFLELSKRKQLERLNSLELAIDQKENNLIILEDKNKSSALAVDCKELVSNASTQKRVHSRPKAKQPKSNIQITNVLPTSAKEESLLTTALPPSDKLPPNETVIEENVAPVHAIFGVEEKPVVTSVSKKAKKIRVRLFKYEDEKGPIQIANEPTNLLARINKN